MELSNFNVSVTSVQPGAVQSAIFDKAQAAGEEHLKTNPGELEVYGHLIKGPEANKDLLKHAAMPDCTTEAIHDALTAKYPKTRIVVATMGNVGI